MLSTVSVWKNVGSTLSISSGGVYAAPVCQGVSLSTATGAKCACGKLKIGTGALAIKALPMGELRQIVASGFKLSHGTPLASITWV